MNCIYQTLDKTALYIQKARLEDAGITVVVFDEDSAAAFGGLPHTPLRLMVAQEDVETALRLLSESEGENG